MEKYNKFSKDICNKLGAYVYALVDPRDNSVFYIGKGRENRVFDHIECELKNNPSDIDSLKLQIIQEIHNAGLKVKHLIIRHGIKANTNKDADAEAYRLESTLIDILSYNELNLNKKLTNVVSGHNQSREGIKTVDEISALYDCPIIEPELKARNEKLLAVKINKSIKDKDKSIYEMARGAWRISQAKCRDIQYVLVIVHGVVRAVYKPQRWYQDTQNKSRWIFDGKEIPGSPYLGKRISKLPKTQNPVIYLNF